MQRYWEGRHRRPLAFPLTCEIKIRASSLRRSGRGPSLSQVVCLSLAMVTGARGMALGSGFWFSVQGGGGCAFLLEVTGAGRGPADSSPGSGFGGLIVGPPVSPSWLTKENKQGVQLSISLSLSFCNPIYFRAYFNYYTSSISYPKD
ncbi:hypothetical protein TIFTF001_009646 [Ficus carica]|uniref:Uncharacterized protein n=1 Tax=Ficus carica TaxID=3494 RepID=A0AA88D2S5_FICCA|nr:hypothetical protein TIFTF001_009646 [Ficus carica]